MSMDYGKRALQSDRSGSEIAYFAKAWGASASHPKADVLAGIAAGLGVRKLM